MLETGPRVLLQAQARVLWCNDRILSLAFLLQSLPQAQARVLKEGNQKQDPLLDLLDLPALLPGLLDRNPNYPIDQELLLEVLVTRLQVAPIHPLAAPILLEAMEGVQSEALLPAATIPLPEVMEGGILP